MLRKEATENTKNRLLKIARRHFTEYGYYGASLEYIVDEAGVTRGALYHHFQNKLGLFKAVYEETQNDVAEHIKAGCLQSEEIWEQLIFGCKGFISGAMRQENARIMLIDAPTVLGWNDWRKADKEISESFLAEHIGFLDEKGFLKPIPIPLIISAISGALTEIAIYLVNNPELAEKDKFIMDTLESLLYGFKLL